MFLLNNLLSHSLKRLKPCFGVAGTNAQMHRQCEVQQERVQKAFHTI